MHISAAAFALQRTASALAGTPLAAGTRICPPTSLHVDARAQFPMAAPEDVEAEQSYSDLDEDYRRELARECGCSTSSCEDINDDAMPRHSMQGHSTQGPGSISKNSAQKTASLSWWLHMGSALLLALVLRKDLVVYGPLSCGVLAVWILAAVREGALPAAWEVATVALAHTLACVVPTPIWRKLPLHGSFWQPWMQRVQVCRRRMGGRLKVQHCLQHTGGPCHGAACLYSGSDDGNLGGLCTAADGYCVLSAKDRKEYKTAIA